MAKIYIITNDINEKSYIGWTSLSLEERLKNHIKDSKNRKYEKRPLYSAMNKYGADKVQLFEDQPIRTAWVEDEVSPRRTDKTPNKLLTGMNAGI